MTAYNSVFKRVEKKYRIDVAERAAVEAAAERLMAVDDYGRTRIKILYLDTPERAMNARSVEKPLY
ncbi:vacuolar transporter, partial [Adlercreutzia sp. DFI.6.23]|nr:vacuolar transporter [Adlercreutzia sp. DFI.6.23]